MDIFGFNNEKDDTGFMHIPDEIVCQTAAVTKMPKIMDSSRKDQFCLKSEFFNLKKFDDENENAPFYMNLWFDESKNNLPKYCIHRNIRFTGIFNFPKYLTDRNNLVT